MNFFTNQACYSLLFLFLDLPYILIGGAEQGENQGERDDRTEE
jgi:hypothetical protein